MTKSIFIYFLYVFFSQEKTEIFKNLDSINSHFQNDKSKFSGHKINRKPGGIIMENN